MQKPLLVFPLILAALSCGCTHLAPSRPASSASPATAEEAPVTTATPVPEESARPAGLEDAGLPVLEYDEIRAIARDTDPRLAQMDGYYTICRDGKWGLMRSDGTEVLACQFSGPLSGCASAELRWHALNEPTMSWDTLDALTAQLQQTGDGEMCSAAHDGNFHYWYYDIDTARVQVYSGFSHGIVEDLEDSDFACGTYLPCRLGTFVDGQGDPDFYRATDPLTLVYANADGTLLNDQTYEAAGCFYDQTLAPACQNGKWLYLDLSGQAVTDAVYEPTYGQDETAYASPLPAGQQRHRGDPLHLWGCCLGRRPVVAEAGRRLARLHTPRCGKTDARPHAGPVGRPAGHHQGPRPSLRRKRTVPLQYHSGRQSDAARRSRHRL